MSIVTNHVAAMYDEAARLARELHGASLLQVRTVGLQSTFLNRDASFEAYLERLDNLVTHARAELEDERLRLRDGWPTV